MTAGDSSAAAHVSSSSILQTMRVGVLLPNPRIPRWAAAVLRDIATRSTLAALIVWPAPESARALTWTCYTLLDDLLNARRDDAMAPASAEDIPNLPRLSEVRGDTIAALAAAVGTQDFDLLLDLTLTGRDAGGLSALARRGVIRITCADEDCGPAFDRAFVERRPSVRMAACLETAGGGVRQLARASSMLDLGSIGRSRSEMLWKASALAARSIDRWAADSAAAPPPASDRSASSAGIVRRPGTLESAKLFSQLVQRAVVRRLRRSGESDPWLLGIRPHRPGAPDAQGFTAFAAPGDRYWADPFLFRRGGKTHLFFEEFQTRRGLGEIACVELPDGALPHAPLQPEIVLSCNHHLAYPLVFEHRGEIYLMPDNEGIGGVELWRSIEFPRRWTLDRVLLEGLPLADVTLHVDADRLWLFATMPAPHGRSFDELHVYWAEQIEGPWHAHPLNPVVADAASARGAGRIFRSGDQLIRPAQDNSERYGGAVAFQIIRTLTLDSYVEEPLGRLEPAWLSDLSATHTWNSDGVYDVVDGRQRKPQ